MEENLNIDQNEQPNEQPTESQTQSQTTAKNAWESKSDTSAADALSKRIADLSTPKEVYQEAVNKTEAKSTFTNNQTTEPNNTGANIPGNSGTSSSITIDQAQTTAKTIVRTENFLIPFVAETFFGLNGDYIKANDKEFKELQEAWAEELKNHPDFKMPSWVALLVTHLAIYAYKIGLAIKAKKELQKTQEAVEQWQQHNQTAENAAPQTQYTPEPTPPPAPTPVYNSGKLTHKCAMPGCDKQIDLKKKYCSSSHRSKHQNQIRRELKNKTI